MARTKGAKSKAKSVSILLEINGETYTSKADTIEDALLNFPPIEPKSIANFTVTVDGISSKPMMYKIPYFKRIFFEGMSGTVQRIQFFKRYEMNRA